MKKIGITGNIGSGKSTVCRIFNCFGIQVYNSDLRAQYLMENLSEIKKEIVDLFGKEAYTNSKLNNAAIARIVFQDRSKLVRLNQIVHPYVRNDFNIWANNITNETYVIQEAAILFESGSNKLLDKVIVVDAPEKLKIRRIMTRDKTSEEQIRKRMNNQFPAEKLKQLADYLIINDGKSLILPQIIKIDQQIRNLSE